jgi:hypothetical protein
MGYFKFTGVSGDYRDEWNDVVTQVQSWPSKYRTCRYSLPEQMSHHLEAKALYVFTMARRLVCSAYRLSKAEGGNWKLIFVEATSLLFPMIELVGHARLGTGGSSKSLWAGILWLHNPDETPCSPAAPQADTTQVPKLLTTDRTHGCFASLLLTWVKEIQLSRGFYR